MQHTIRPQSRRVEKNERPVFGDFNERGVGTNKIIISSGVVCKVCQKIGDKKLSTIKKWLNQII